MRSSSPHRTITPDEVRGWLKGYRKPLSECACADIARTLTQMRWTCDVGPPAPPAGCTVLPPNHGDDRYWDVEAAASAAKLLQVAMPRMLEHWERLTWAPETAGGHRLMKALADALEAALPCIEHPFGEPKSAPAPRTGSRQKVWHVPAVVIARVIYRAMQTSGQGSPAISHNSTVVTVVQKALDRMGYGDRDRMTIGKHLTRWHERYGLFSKEGDSRRGRQGRGKRRPAL